MDAYNVVETRTKSGKGMMGGGVGSMLEKKAKKVEVVLLCSLVQGSLEPFREL